MTLYIAVAALVVAVACLVLLIVLLVRQRGLDPAKLTDAVADEVTQRSAIALNTVKTDLVNEGRANRVESAAQVRMLCRELCPDCVIAIDALAGAEFSRLCRTVQICDAGIAPGSGVGNDREALDRDALGVPVVAVGVPTVMDASLLSRDPAMAAMFVTPRSIDSDVRAAARLIAYGIDLALHRELSVADIDMLVG